MVLIAGAGDTAGQAPEQGKSAGDAGPAGGGHGGRRPENRGESTHQPRAQALAGHGAGRVQAERLPAQPGRHAVQEGLLDAEYVGGAEAAGEDQYGRQGERRTSQEQQPRQAGQQGERERQPLPRGGTAEPCR